jgi:D-glycero-alpha-D-manno-heptose 1-phosphate guanylyltransferase
MEPAAPLVVILAGGAGTRIRHLLPDVPKPLAPVAGRPFLDWVIRYLHEQGLDSIVISAGFLAGKVEAFAAERGVACVREPVALGTGGGFLHALAASRHKERDVLACNGDSLVLTDLRPLLQTLQDASVDAALLGVRVADASRFGTLQVGVDGALLGFAEKRAGAGLINGGVYLLRRAVIGRFPTKRPLSFEYDVFPSLIGSGARIATVPCDAPFLDIGTEASLAQAGAFIRDNMRWFA